MEKEENKIVLGNDKIEGLVLPMSKNKLKKMRRKEEWEKKKKEIKKIKREKQKEKKKELKEKEVISKTTNNKESIHIPKRERIEELKKKIEMGIRIVIDCDFEHLMNEKSINSMSRQISDCYSINRKSEIPFNLILYNVGPLLYEELKKNHFENWIGITVYKKGIFQDFNSFIKEALYPTKEIDFDILKQKIYYLSADSENELKILDKDATYIIGGIVDRNKYKFLSLNKAKELGINHGKFPIGEYIQLSSSKVLTTNHTFSILNQFNLKQDWKEAFLSVIPKRKIDEMNK